MGAAALAEVMTKIASSPTPATASVTVSQVGTTCCGTAVAAVISNAAPSVNDTAPGQCSAVACPRSSGTTRTVATSRITAIGARHQKIARQPAAASRPPSGGPMACPIPLAAQAAHRAGPLARPVMVASMPMTACG